MKKALRKFVCSMCRVTVTANPRKGGRKAKPTVLRVAKLNLRYPYGTSDALVRRINESVPSALPEDIREDVCQNMLIAILEGSEERDVAAGVQRFILEHRREYPFRYNFSIDANPAKYERAG